MSWLFSQALVEEYSEESYLVGEPSVQSSGKPTQQAYCAPDKMTEFSRLSRFGMTFKPLMVDRGEELLTLYREDFHVPTSVPQEKAQELTEKPLECGEKWRGSFVKYDPVTSSWKTHQCSLAGDLDEFLETWPQWGLMRDGECWEQRTLERHIRGTEFGLSPNGVDSFHTPNTTGLDGGSNSRKALRKRLDLWPTPVHSEARQGLQIRRDGKKGTQTSLSTAVLTWPTPVADDTSHRKNKYAQGGTALSTKAGGQLNPPWVEWLMGWPIGWTDLKPLETDKFHCAPQQHGES